MDHVVNLNNGSTMAQTHARGPLCANGSGKPLSSIEMDAIRLELAEMKVTHGLKEP